MIDVFIRNWEIAGAAKWWFGVKLVNCIIFRRRKKLATKQVWIKNNIIGYFGYMHVTIVTVCIEYIFFIQKWTYLNKNINS